MRKVLMSRFAGGFAGLALLCSMSLSAQAQDAQSSQQSATQQEQQASPQTAAPDQGAKMHGRAMFANLNLTDDQKAQLKKIHENTKSQIEAVQNDSSLTADQKQAKMHQLRRDARKQTSQVLTPDQRKQLRAEMREHRAARRQNQEPSQPQAQPQG